jgi:hypothetical protein
MNREQWTEMWWLAQPPQVRELRSMPADEARTAKALSLAQTGFTILIPVCVYGWDAHNAMECYQANGFKWVPALLQNLTVAQFPLNPWELSQDTPMPKGSIKVSLAEADYPPFDPPSVPAPAPSFVPVGINLYGNVYASVTGDTYADGSPWADQRGKFEKHSCPFFGIHRAWWEKVA